MASAACSPACRSFPSLGGRARMFAIQGEKLSRNYGAFRALMEVDIAVPIGQIRGLIGPNGAGKSTLIDVLSGRAMRVSGIVKFDGRDITALNAQKRRLLGLSR